MRKICINILLTFALFVLSFGQSQELFLKAAYLEKFAMFTEWPDSRTHGNQDSFVIKVIGDKEYYTVIKNFYSRFKIRDKKVEVKYITEVKEIDSCHILFITKVSRKKLNKIVNFTKQNPILTISDTKDYALKGVLINFFIFDDKIRFEVNKEAINRSGLVLSYHLLKFAKIVNSAEY